jgi:nitrogen fixation protein FixH
VDAVELYTILGVLAILLGVIVYNNVAAALATRRRAAAAPAASPWMGRHVQFEGDVVGEVVAEEGDRLILRRGDRTLAVPRAQVRPQGLDLSLASFDRAAAQAEGEAWQARGGAAP